MTESSDGDRSGLSALNLDGISGGDGGGEVWKFRLYIAGSGFHSVNAQNNLKELCRQFLNNVYQVEVIDLMKEPGRMFRDQVLVTPTLVRYWPEPICTLIGNLSNRREVLRALGLEEFSP